ncbi:hypothetical protein, conserved [Eimeria acervulina]|uniref:Uncharacterized protein n=1 Tax=Eimeria acervulina TaxID=5801 RepID=U6GQE2_EIMAC|nr:hypothetical protein, conserved [Eimeria acervulina]CDI81787.1 hypothetical protein, conserved [Eimeria acervulina]
MSGALSFDLKAETEALRAKYLEQLESGCPCPRLQFEFASLLICSPNVKDLKDSADLLTELLEIGFCRSDCLFQLALVYLKLGHYSLAKRRVEALLRMGLGVQEPRNLSALSLHSLILDRAAYDGVSGSLILGLIAGGVLPSGSPPQQVRWRSLDRGPHR